LQFLGSRWVEPGQREGQNPTTGPDQGCGRRARLGRTRTSQAAPELIGATLPPRPRRP